MVSLCAFYSIFHFPLLVHVIELCFWFLKAFNISLVFLFFPNCFCFNLPEVKPQIIVMLLSDPLYTYSTNKQRKKPNFAGQALVALVRP